MTHSSSFGLGTMINLMDLFSTHSAPLTIVLLKQWPFLSTIQTCSVHTAGQASCAELVKKVIVWYWVLLNAGSVPTAILLCSSLLQ